MSAVCFVRMFKLLPGILNLNLFRIFLANLGENAKGQNSDFQLQYKLNETEHHPEIVMLLTS